MPAVQQGVEDGGRGDRAGADGEAEQDREQQGHDGRRHRDSASGWHTHRLSSFRFGGEMGDGG
ncbi:hypothetical protein GCM10009837_38520 [Streptomyces durmitorensis]